MLKFGLKKKYYSQLSAAEEKIGNEDFHLVKEIIHSVLFKASNKQMEKIYNGDASVEVYIYSAIVNISGDMVESGKFHLYRGMLNGHGNRLKDIFINGIDELVAIGVLDNDEAEKNKYTLLQNILEVG